MNTETLMKEIALGHPTAARVLDKIQLNYCCNGGGKISLAEACKNAGLDAEAVFAQLEQAQALSTAEPQWDLASSLSALIGYIVDTHHGFTRGELARLAALLNRLVNRHGEVRPELHDIKLGFLALRDDLIPHLMKEENVLFPYIEALEKHRKEGAPLPPACFGTIENPLQQMYSEHDKVTELLKRLRRLTNNYAPPADVCPSYRIALQALQGLETDLLRHIHLENDILFPQARELTTTA